MYTWNEIFAHTHNINIDDVRLAFNFFLSDCIDGIFLYSFINGTELLFYYIYMLFSMMLTHGVAPQGLLLSTLVLYWKIREAINVTLIIIDKLWRVAATKGHQCRKFQNWVRCKIR